MFFRGHPARRNFNPRSPRGERPLFELGDLFDLQFQPSLPARGATLDPCEPCDCQSISTLAPREGSDPSGWLVMSFCCDFNPRSPRGERPPYALALAIAEVISTLAPREGSDLPVPSMVDISTLFQPSLPARGATSDGRLLAYDLQISTLAPREGSDLS